MSYMFSFCSSLTELDLSNFNTNNVKNMSDMFSFCRSLTALDLSSFNTENVIHMSWMFAFCTSLTKLDLSNFNTEKVTSMSYMFYYCSKLTEIKFPDDVNTDNVTNMSRMFSGCISLTVLNLSNFNTKNVTNMSDMFYNCSKLTVLDLSSFNTENVTDMSCMFNECTSLTELDLSKWDTTNVTNIDSMFNGFFQGSGIDRVVMLICSGLFIKKIIENVQDGDDFNKLSITNDLLNSKDMYKDDKKYICLIEYDWKILMDKITSIEDFKPIVSMKDLTMDQVIFEYRDFRNNINSTVLSKIVNGQIDNKQVMNVKIKDAGMYYVQCDNIISSFLTSFNEGIFYYNPYNKKYLCVLVKINDKEYVIYCSNANSVCTREDVDSGIFTGGKFTKAKVLFCGREINSLQWMFANCFYLTELNLSRLNTAEVRDMHNMFQFCNSLTALDLSNFNTNKVKNMYAMFSMCENLTYLNLSSFNTDKVTDMSDMFYKCFTEEQPSTLICKSSTIKKITDNKDSCLNFSNDFVKKVIENNKDTVYKSSVERWEEKGYLEGVKSKIIWIEKEKNEDQEEINKLLYDSYLI